MVDAIVPSLAGLFFITVVALEESDGFLVAYTNHDLSLFTIFTTGAVGAQQVNVVLRIGNTHTAGLGFHPREGTQGHRGLRLSEAFHHLDASLFLELVEDGGVQSLASCTAVL